MFKIVTIVLLSILLQACSITPKQDIVNVTPVEVKYSSVPSELLKPCTPEIPIAKERYLELKPQERELYMTDYSIKLLKIIKECDIKLKKIKSLVKEE